MRRENVQHAARKQVRKWARRRNPHPGDGVDPASVNRGLQEWHSGLDLEHQAWVRIGHNIIQNTWGLVPTNQPIVLLRIVRMILVF